MKKEERNSKVFVGLLQMNLMSRSLVSSEMSSIQTFKDRRL